MPPSEWAHSDAALDADHVPTPDPASPCGFVMFGEPCGGTEDEHGDQTDPPYQPTRCTCGHPIQEAVR